MSPVMGKVKNRKNDVSMKKLKVINRIDFDNQAEDDGDGEDGDS